MPTPMKASNELVLIPESRLRVLLEETGEKVARLILRESANPAASTRPDKGWLTNKEAMAYLGLSRASLARFRADGTLPYSKIGGSVFYKLADVEALLESGRQDNE